MPSPWQQHSLALALCPGASSTRHSSASEPSTPLPGQAITRPPPCCEELRSGGTPGNNGAGDGSLPETRRDVLWARSGRGDSGEEGFERALQSRQDVLPRRQTSGPTRRTSERQVTAQKQTGTGAGACGAGRGHWVHRGAGARASQLNVAAAGGQGKLANEVARPRLERTTSEKAKRRPGDRGVGTRTAGGAWQRRSRGPRADRTEELPSTWGGRGRKPALRGGPVPSAVPSLTKAWRNKDRARGRGGGHATAVRCLRNSVVMKDREELRSGHRAEGGADQGIVTTEQREGSGRGGEGPPLEQGLANPAARQSPGRSCWASDSSGQARPACWDAACTELRGRAARPRPGPAVLSLPGSRNCCGLLRRAEVFTHSGFQSRIQ